MGIGLRFGFGPLRFYIPLTKRRRRTNYYSHGTCTIRHRTPETASRCNGTRIGVTEDPSRLLGDAKKANPSKPGKALAVALVELSERIVELEQRVAAVDANTTECARCIAKIDNDLAHLRTARTRMAADTPRLPSPAVRAQATAKLAEHDANIARIEDRRIEFEALMHTNATNHAEELRWLAEFRAKRDAALGRF